MPFPSPKAGGRSICDEFRPVNESPAARTPSTGEECATAGLPPGGSSSSKTRLHVVLQMG